MPRNTPFDLGDLMLGVATASLQIEGGDRNNSWYDWAALPGTIADGSTPLRATDHWRRWREDTDLMASLGIRTYRMSVEWSRIEPALGEFDATAIDRYREELTEIRARGIVPLVTLHHFSNPSWFQGMGEFTHERSVPIFLRFARYVVENLGDLVQDWVTINEPNVYVTQAHLWGEGPPGDESWPAVRASLRNLAHAHCLAYRMIHDVQREKGRPQPRVGFAHHARVFEPLNARNPVHKALAKASAYLFQDGIADAMLGGRFPRLLGQPDDVRPGRYYDFIGINYYARTAVSKLADGTFPGAPVNDLGWEIHPAGIAEVARRLHARYPAPIWITENGTCDNGRDGQVETFRARYIVDHLRALVDSGLPVQRYYHWCFIDNWEWSLGEVPRFGLVALDYETQERTVKPSGRMYAEIAAAGVVTADILARYVDGQEYQLEH